VLLDIGGGSTEVIRHAPPLPDHAKSLPLGVMALSERYLQHDPPLADEVAALRRHADHVLGAARAVWGPLVGPRQPRPLLIGTAGTATTLAAMDLRLRSYCPGLINGHRLQQAAVRDLLTRMLSMPALQRRGLAGLEPGRATVIISGALVVLAAMDLLAAPSMLVSDAGLLEGVLVDKMAASRTTLPPAL